MSVAFQNFEILKTLRHFMQHEQYIIQSDATKTFDTIFKGPRIKETLDRPDKFIDWIEKSQDN